MRNDRMSSGCMGNCRYISYYHDFHHHSSPFRIYLLLSCCWRTLDLYHSKLFLLFFMRKVGRRRFKKLTTAYIFKILTHTNIAFTKVKFWERIIIAFKIRISILRFSNFCKGKHLLQKKTRCSVYIAAKCNKYDTW